MPEQLIFTQFLNHTLGGPVANMLHALGGHPIRLGESAGTYIFTYNPDAPITNFVAMQILVFLLLLVFFILVRARLSVDRPGALQHTVEGLENFIQGQSDEIIGHHSEKFTAFLTILGIFILVSNLIGLIPGFVAPTASPLVTMGCSLCAFAYYNWHGLRKQGAFGYLKHFMGPVWWLGFLMFPIEIISHLARLMSLTIRLFANMFVGDLLTLVFFSLFPLLLPVVFMGLHIGVSFLQAYIFVLLTTIYLAGAVAEEH